MCIGLLTLQSQTNFCPSLRETGNPWEYFGPDAITRATSCPFANVQANWPLIHRELAQRGLASKNSQAVMIATVAIESASSFTPRYELYDGDPYQYFESHYGYQTSTGQQLGNTLPGDGYKFRGAGFIQATGKANAIRYGNLLGKDILNHPETMIDPTGSAEFAGEYWKQHDIATMSDRGEWEAARRAVNGGTNGLPRLIQIVQALGV